MYDYRTPLKKRGPVQHSSSRSHRRSSPVRRSQSRPLSRPTRQTVSSSGSFSFLSLAIGLGLLATAAMISYVIIFQMILPASFPVAREEVVLLSGQLPPVAGQQVTLVRFSPTQHKLTVVSGRLPSTPESQPIPLSWQLSVPIDRQILVEGYQPLTNRVETKHIFRQLLVQPGPHQATFRERVSWWLFSRSVPRSQVSIQLMETDQDWARVSRRFTEGRNQTVCQVAVVNTTNQSGLATGLSSLLEHAGFVVIKVGDTQQVTEKTEIVIDDGRNDCLVEAERVGKFIQVSGEESTQTVPFAQANIMSQYRAPIVIRIGQDVAPVLDEFSKLAE